MNKRKDEEFGDNTATGLPSSESEFRKTNEEDGTENNSGEHSKYVWLRKYKQQRKL